MPPNHIIKVLVVDGSLFFQATLQNVLLGDQGISVVGTASNATEATKRIQELSPDVVTMNVEVPDTEGTDFLRRPIPRRPVPVMLVSSLDLGIFGVLNAGTVDFIRKPTARTDYDLFFTELVIKIRVASTVKIKAKAPSPLDSLPTPTLSSDNEGEKVIAIGASTDGTKAMPEILKKLPVNIPGILVVQHIPPGFTKVYAGHLSRLCNFSVAKAQDGERAEPGRAYTAPGGKHITLVRDSRGYYTKCAAGEKVSGRYPSVDVLSRSIVETTDKDVMGIILIGIGSDGVKGLLKMRRRGSFTISQDETSCIVYGIPMVAFDIGTVIRQAPCPSITGIIIQHLDQAK